MISVDSTPLPEDVRVRPQEHWRAIPPLPHGADGVVSVECPPAPADVCVRPPVQWRAVTLLPPAPDRAAVVTPAPPAGVGVPTRALWRRIATSPLWLATALVGVALAIRSIGLVHSFELWVDEMLYADLGASASRGEMPRLADGPFFLHPPGFFLLEGGVIRLLHIPTADSMDLVFDLRWLTAALGACTVGLVFLVARRVAGTWPAVAGALVLVAEPFVLRINSRVFLESLGGLALVAGLLLLVRYLQHPAAGRVPRTSHHRGAGARRARARVLHLVGGGLLLGYAVLTKDAFALFTVVPVLLAVAWRATLTLREALVVVAAAAVPYVVYLVVAASTGYLGNLTRAKFAGVLRLIGTHDTTGFNAPGAPSLLGRLVEQALHYGTSYVLLLLCPLAGLIASCSRVPERRLVGLTAVTTGAYGAYMVAFGTAEEQYAYPITIAGALVLAVVGRMAWDHRPALRRAIVPALAVFLAAETTLGLNLETTRDDGLLTFRTWAREHLPATARVGATNGASGYAYADDPRFGPWPSAALLQARGAQYVLTFSLPTRQGYTLAKPALLDWLEAHATPLFQTTGPTNGATVLWYVDAQELARAAAEDVGGPLLPGGDTPGPADRPVAPDSASGRPARGAG